MMGQKLSALLEQDIANYDVLLNDQPQYMAQQPVGANVQKSSRRPNGQEPEKPQSIQWIRMMAPTVVNPKPNVMQKPHAAGRPNGPVMPVPVRQHQQLAPARRQQVVPPVGRYQQVQAGQNERRTPARSPHRVNPNQAR